MRTLQPALDSIDAFSQPSFEAYRTARRAAPRTTPSVPPARDIAARRRRLEDPLDDPRREHLVIAEPADGVGPAGVAVPAVLGPVAVGHLAAVGGVLGLLEEVFHQVDRII